MSYLFRSIKGQEKIKQDGRLAPAYFTTSPPNSQWEIEDVYLVFLTTKMIIQFVNLEIFSAGFQ